MTKAKLLQPFGTAVPPAEQTSGDVPAGLLSATFAGLTEAGYDLPEEATVEIETIADEFAAASSTRRRWDEPSHQKQVLKALVEGADVYEAFRALAPEYRFELASYLNPVDADWVLDPVSAPADLIARVWCAASKLARNYNPRPGRRTDVALEAAVRALMEVLVPLLVASSRYRTTRARVERVRRLTAPALELSPYC